jgi:GH24 family phage-related lysozyme (muramidase)
MITIAILAAHLITPLENVRLTAYWDATGKRWSIGYGRAHGITAGMRISLWKAKQWFIEDTAPLVELVKDRPILEAAALVSFGYNCGIGSLKRYLSGNIAIKAITNSDGDPEFHYFADGQIFGETSGGVPLSDLARRRALEIILIQLAHQPMPIPSPIPDTLTQ